MSEVAKKIQEEVDRYNEINKYGIKLNEQTEDLPPLPGGEGGNPAGELEGLPPLPGGENSQDIPAPEGEETPEEEPVDPAEDDETEEIDITDLVNITKNIKQELESNKSGDTGVTQKMDGVFAKLGELESKLGEMDQIIGKIDELGGRKCPHEPHEKKKLEIEAKRDDIQRYVRECTNRSAIYKMFNYVPVSYRRSFHDWEKKTR